MAETWKGEEGGEGVDRVAEGVGGGWSMMDGESWGDLSINYSSSFPVIAQDALAFDLEGVRRLDSLNFPASRPVEEIWTLCVYKLVLS